MKQFFFSSFMSLFLLASSASYGQQSEYQRTTADRTKAFEKAERQRTRALDKANRKDEAHQRKLAKAKEKYERDQDQLKTKYNRKQHQLASKYTKANSAGEELTRELQKLKADYEADQLALRQRYERDRDKRQAAWEAERPSLSLVKLQIIFQTIQKGRLRKQPAFLLTHDWASWFFYLPADKQGFRFSRSLCS